jgi:hypothetical protein
MESDSLFAEGFPALLQRHYESLRTGSGISDEVIRQRGYSSILSHKELQQFGFSAAQQRHPGVLMRVWPPDGKTSLYTYRPDTPRETIDGKVLKYELPKGAKMRLDVPLRCRTELADPRVTLWFTEGQKKADALATHGLTAVALLGVWNFKGKNDFGGVTLLADFDYIALKGRIVNAVFDSDVMTKPSVQKALARLTEHLQRKGAQVNAVYLPPGGDGAKCGVDDYLLSHTVADLQALVTAPRPEPKAAAPMVELLDEPPSTLNRPLALVGDTAYAATWPWVKKTINEELGKDGQVVRLDPPKVVNTRELFVVQQNGRIYGSGGDKPLEELGVEVHLPEIPRDEKLWRASGVKAYHRGERPNYADVFQRVATVYDHYLDFNLSVADQRTMCEFSACAVLITWLSAAFSVLGYFWPTGDKGSGKTKWATIWAMLSYLGEVILSSGTFAAVRDLADYGGALAFDDAEVIADPKRCDPNKRELLLAGNRRVRQYLSKSRIRTAAGPRAGSMLSAPERSPQSGLPTTYWLRGASRFPWSVRRILQRATATRPTPHVGPAMTANCATIFGPPPCHCWRRQSRYGRSSTPKLAP